MLLDRLPIIIRCMLGLSIGILTDFWQMGYGLNAASWGTRSHDVTQSCVLPAIAGDRCGLA